MKLSMHSLTDSVIQQLNRHLPRWQHWVQLLRLDKPVGFYLLLWPTLWALWIAAQGIPDWHLLLVFIAGVVVMRSAGCVINDIADRNIDGHVQRTQKRPLATGAISTKEAVITFVILCIIALLLVMMTNHLTMMLSIGGLALASLYPFMKRYTHLPQVVLGAAFSWAVPMAFASQSNEIPSVAWLLYLANLLWTVAYDTIYAMVDRDDDVLIGVKSTAILFGDLDVMMIAMLKGMSLFCLLLVAGQLELHWPFYLAILIASIWQIMLIWTIRTRNRTLCFKAFRQNHWFGFIVLTGLITSFGTASST